MSNPEYKDKKIQDTDPAKLDQQADEKYFDAMREKTQSLSEADKSIPNEDDDVFQNADDSPSSEDEEGVTQEGEDNVTPEERADLQRSATRMPEENDDMADMPRLDAVDMEGTPLNENDDMMGDDLDINESEEDSNIYDDNDD